MFKNKWAKEDEMRARRQDADPWPKMAVEKQFNLLVERETELGNQEWDPPTLRYLREHQAEYSLENQHLMDNTIQELEEAWGQGQYAKKIREILWEGLPMSVAINRTLDNPDSLMSEAARHGLT